MNWEPENELTNKCQIFRFTFPDGKEAHIERKHLLEIFFACGKPEDQQKMIPQTLETVHHYKTVLGIKANKDIYKDEMINFPIELTIPCSTLTQDFIGPVPKGAKIIGNGGIPWKG